MTDTIFAAYAAYRMKCVQEGVGWREDPSAQATMRREHIKMEVGAEFGLDYFAFELDRLETYMEATDLRRALLTEHRDAEDLTYAKVMEQYYARPNHHRDLPQLALPLVLEHCMPQDEAVTLLKFAWTMPEFPADSEDVAHEWIEAFSMLVWVTDVDGEEPPEEPLTLYRGADRDSGGRGLAWTTDPDRAKWFAYRLGREGRTVFTAVAPPGVILAHFTGRNEDEYVVDYSLLTDIKELEA